MMKGGWTLGPRTGRCSRDNGMQAGTGTAQAECPAAGLEWSCLVAGL